MKKVDRKCLYCYQLLANDEIDFHARCSMKFFGQPKPPELSFSKNDMNKLARQIVIRSVTVTGVQPKLSVNIEPVAGNPKNFRFTLVGLWGGYILKPPTDEFPQLPENEDLTMHLARILKIKTARHSLIRLKSGELAYLTKRFDRTDNAKVAVEDMCQLTETLTEDKYRSSMEKVGKAIAYFSTQPGIDLITFFELTLFAFLTGNTDMHLKNFSLISTIENGNTFSPAYDLLSTRLLMPEDTEEMALTLAGKKSKFKRADFDSFASNLKLNPKTVEAVYRKFSAQTSHLYSFIDESFLSASVIKEYKALLQERVNRLQLFPE